MYKKWEGQWHHPPPLFVAQYIDKIVSKWLSVTWLSIWATITKRSLMTRPFRNIFPNNP